MLEGNQPSGPGVSYQTAT